MYLIFYLFLTVAPAAEKHLVPRLIFAVYNRRIIFAVYNRRIFENKGSIDCFFRMENRYDSSRFDYSLDPVFEGSYRPLFLCVVFSHCKNFLAVCYAEFLFI
ncbi:hypothetical protein Y032_0077g1090 [Ancylostoma ceylanicum]|uniref:Secreted protein n=1 Tax=Ancylostoma ceylanicum TaxID=53326 RepID=A0A016TTX8_9BILA|nr:hypothetical protein Y032_0077g1090 [Ancylostoma ceylanicum]